MESEEIKLVKPSKLKSYMVFTKFRLSALVILSALSGYLFVGEFDWWEMTYLLVGGLLVTAASNGSNQIWERDLDKKMNRTSKRPLPLGHMSVNEAYAIVILCLISGTALLLMLNLSSALLGLGAFVSYVFMYTPMKRKSSWAVFVGAFPGAIPPLLGAVAHDEVGFGMIPGVLFFVQFTWQFPHFWAIAWVAYDDYKAGGFSLLPSKKGKSKESAFQIVAYSLILIPFSLIPWLLGYTGIWSMIVATIFGAGFFLYAYRLFLTLDDKDARKLMFASFFYLPVIQFVYVFDRII
ncbi:MAG: heme o synthase [Crocinitomicaceae bacterium]|jgi:heme o synthase|nr:heme o synthase [Crocinitomicaceae bacterium]MDG1659054.1 heme o synthase [Crocinitomicaceae bacterium]MDG2440419.1 heme o synthase [Crocinitomicaceae bacterium]|tara:strand:- start:4489 stop:5370 length:882 start_codon:yes stop_codon:yes gene_type:complete